MSSVINLQKITRDFHSGDSMVQVLKGIDLHIKAEEMIAIMGASGSGKSTLMNIIGLLDNATSGEYFLENRNVSMLLDNERSYFRNLKIGFVFQSFFLLPRFSALENVQLPLIYRGTPVSERKERAVEALEKVGMKDFIHRRPTRLSGGQQQRVAIARAIAGKPSVILADEPTGALDSKTSDAVMNIFHDLNQQEGVTTIIVTHDKGVADQCKRSIFLKDGLVYEDKEH